VIMRVRTCVRGLAAASRHPAFVEM
jgi:hypothetical protein